MDRLEAMTIFIAAVEAGSLSAASRRLGVPLPTVSRKVADLEAHLNTRLLVRSTRKLALTDAGAAYLAASKSILEQVGDAERAVSGEYVTPKGDLVIAAPIVFGRLHVLPVVNTFLATFPDINVQMVLSDRNADLIGDHIDMAVRIGALPDSSMVARASASCAAWFAQARRFFRPMACRRRRRIWPASRASPSAMSWRGHPGCSRQKARVHPAPRRFTHGSPSTRRKPPSMPPSPASGSRRFCLIRSRRRSRTKG